MKNRLLSFWVSVIALVCLFCLALVQLVFREPEDTVDECQVELEEARLEVTKWRNLAMSAMKLTNKGKR